MVSFCNAVNFRAQKVEFGVAATKPAPRVLLWYPNFLGGGQTPMGQIVDG